jgi:hypothetical protein
MAASSSKRSDREYEEETIPIKKQLTTLHRRGRVFVAKYNPYKIPQSSETMEIAVITTSKKGYGQLSPHNMRDEKGRLFMNIIQFSKLFRHVQQQNQHVNKKYAVQLWRWHHQAEQHYEDRTRLPTAEFWNWHDKGMVNPFPVMWPNGPAYSMMYLGFMIETTPSDNHVSCIHPISKAPYKMVGRIEGRKQTLCALYRKYVPDHPEFKKLMHMLNEGKDVMILEYDGPLTSRYTTSPIKESIVDINCLLIDKPETIHYLLHDEKNWFGHGFAIAALLNDPSGVWMD